MANVGTALPGKTLIGAGNGASPTFANIGTNSGLTSNGVVIAGGNGAFTATGAGVLGQVLTSNGPGVNPTFQPNNAVVGPASSTDNNIAVFDGITGKIIKDTGISSISPVFTGNVSAQNFNLPLTSATTGVLNINAAPFMHSAGTGGTYLGIQAGNPANTSIACTGIGFGALASLTSGISNTCTGFASGNQLTTGNYNTAYGESSLYLALASIGGTVAIGYKALVSGQADFSVAIGYNAMSGGVTGTGNTGVGTNSCLKLVGGGSNSCFGSRSGEAATSGNNNTFLGTEAGFAVTTGSDNIFVGRRTGFPCTSGESSNIYVGNVGVVAENNTLRIGTSGAGAGQQNKAFVAGIAGVTVAGSEPVSIDTNGQLSSLGFGTAGQALKSTGAASSPTWQDEGSYAMSMITQSTSFNPADSQVYYTANSLGWNTALQSTGRMWIPKSGTIRSAYGAVSVIGTLGSAEDCTISIRLNGTTDTNVTTTLKMDAALNTFGNAALSIAVAAGDYVHFMITTPAWVTNPTSTVFNGTLLIN
jgi:hypothetical protein